MTISSTNTSFEIPVFEMHDAESVPVKLKRKREDDPSTIKNEKKARVQNEAITAVVKPSLKRNGDTLSNDSIKRLRAFKKREREEGEHLDAPDAKKVKLPSRKRAAEPFANENVKRARTDDKPLHYYALQDGSSKANQLPRPKARPNRAQQQIAHLNSNSSIYEMLRKDKKRSHPEAPKSKEPALKKQRIEPVDPMDVDLTSSSDQLISAFGKLVLGFDGATI